jgi:DNA-binding transcriptional LysR family regulator
MLSTQRLRVFQQVVRSGSLAGAARELSYTQPAVAHHVAELEREAGTALVVRHGRGVRLTEAGSALAAHADAVLSRLSAAQDEVAAIAGLRAGRVRIAAYPTAAATLVPPALARLRRDHPAIEVSLQEREPPEALAALQAGDVDLAVTFGYPESGAVDADRGGLRDVAFTVLGDDPIDIVVPSDHPAAAAAHHRLADLSGETWVAGCDRCRAHLVDTCRRAGFDPAIAFTTDDFVTQQALVAAGLAVAAMPRSTLGAHADPGVRAAPCAELTARQVAVAVIGDPVPPAVAALRDRLSGLADRLAPSAPSPAADSAASVAASAVSTASTST